MQNPKNLKVKNEKPNAEFSKTRRTICKVVAVGSAACVVSQVANPLKVFAKTAAELEKELEDLANSLKQHKEDLAELETSKASARKKQENAKAQVEILKEQIELVLKQIEAVQAEINTKEQEIATKIEEIAKKQAEYDEALELFRLRLGAMQEINDDGGIGFLSKVENLYQLLTFQQTLQDIADSDEQTLEQLEIQRKQLETAKADLETAKTALDAQYKKLEEESKELEVIYAEYKETLKLVTDDINEIEKAQKEVEDLIYTETIEYEKVSAEIQALIDGAGNNYGDLEFSTDFVTPINHNSYWISRGFLPNVRHYGVDYASPAWTPIYAIASGYVTASGMNYGGYGNYVLIYHGKKGEDTFSSLYAHMVQTPSVVVGQYVTAGQLIGYVGNTGVSRGNHLHFELWRGSNINNSVGNKAQRVDPKNYMYIKF